MNAKAKILVVDDDIDIHRLLAARMRKAGYEIVTAEDGVGCMQQARREQPDLIVLDLGIPGGDGYTSLQRIRGSSTFVTTPIVVLTGNEDAHVEERARKLGANEFLTKSEGTDALLAAIERCLSGEERPDSKITAPVHRPSKRAEPVEEIELNILVGSA